MYELHGGDAQASWVLPHRFKVCPDGPGESADIAAGDTWVAVVPDPETAKTDPGHTAVIARSAAGKELFNAAIRESCITVEQEITQRIYDMCQNHHVSKKSTACTTSSPKAPCAVCNQAIRRNRTQPTDQDTASTTSLAKCSVPLSQNGAKCPPS